MRVSLGDELDDLEALREDEPELYDDYMELVKASEQHPISESAQRGRELFFVQRVNCTACHVGANLTDEKYHNLGIGMDAESPDLGRFTVTRDDKDRGAFKTPTIRNVALTAPYMHDGSLKTLAEVVEWYDKGGHPNQYLDKDVKKLNLTDQEKQDLVAFMEACTGSFPDVERARLPQ
jgi:cytochrome c peroxidase